MEQTRNSVSRLGQLPRRILMTADTVGGVWQYSLDLARGLTRSGIEVHLAAMGGRANDAQRQVAAAIDGLHLHDTDFRLEWMTDPWTDVEEAGVWLLDLAADLRPNLIHLNNFAHGGLRWRRPVLMVGHSCVFSWFDAVEQRLPGDEWRRYRIEVARGLAAANAVTAPSDAMLRALRHHYGRFNSIGPIYNGADASCFVPALKEPIVFGAGRLWDNAKNLALLDQAAGDLRWPVFLAGVAQHPDGGTADFSGSKSLGLLDRDQMCHWLGKTSIYVLPARYEPFGLSALEAALSGCALVLGDIPSLREIWGDSAVFVDPQNGSALREVVNGLIEDESGRADMAQRAQKRAQQYTLERMWSGYLRAYSELLRETAQRRVRTLPQRLPLVRRIPTVPAPRTGT